MNLREAEHVPEPTPLKTLDMIPLAECKLDLDFMPSLLPFLPSSSGLIIIFGLNCAVGQLPLVMLLLSFQLSDSLLP